MEQTTRKASKGFTLIELLFVVMVLAILAAALIPRSPGILPELDAVAEQLASNIRLTQALSMSNGQAFHIQFDESNASYEVLDADNNPPEGTEEVDLPSGFTLATNSAIEPNDLIAFDGKGIPYTDTTVATPLSGNGTITLTAQNESLSVLVRSLTGWTRVES